MRRVHMADGAEVSRVGNVDDASDADVQVGVRLLLLDEEWLVGDVGMRRSRLSEKVKALVVKSIGKLMHMLSLLT